MIISDRSGGSVDARSALGGGDSIEDIVRRIDHLLQSVAGPGGPHAPEAAVDDLMLEDARRERRATRARERVFGSGLCANPAWEILLELFIAKAEDRQVTVASTVAATALREQVALRTITHLAEEKLVVRQHKADDIRNIYLTLSNEAVASFCDYFNQLRTGRDDAAP